MPRLVLLNGPPGIGKSTLSALYADRHPGTLNLDIDSVRLRGGRDVVVPQFVARLDEIAAFDDVAREQGAAFGEVVLLDSRDEAIARFARRAEHDDDPWIQPMRSTEAFADECLSSVLGQTGADLEVIAVDDDSPDGCGALIDRYARADHRIAALLRDRSCGVGAARNAGIARANGEYLLFLDGDDAFHADDVLAGLDDDLTRTGDPDVLMFDYEQSRPCGLGRRSNLAWVVAVDAPHLVEQAERPEALRVSWVCWNKAYRRDYVTRTRLRFPAGYYEDFVWSLCAVLAADRVAVSGRVGVDYRCCRTSSSERRRVIPPDLLPEFRRRSDALAARMSRSDR